MLYLQPGLGSKIHRLDWYWTPIKQLVLELMFVSMVSNGWHWRWSTNHLFITNIQWIWNVMYVYAIYVKYTPQNGAICPFYYTRTQFRHILTVTVTYVKYGFMEILSECQFHVFVVHFSYKYPQSAFIHCLAIIVVLFRNQRDGYNFPIFVCNISLRRRHNERDGVSNHQPHDCLLKRLFRHR